MIVWVFGISNKKIYWWFQTKIYPFYVRTSKKELNVPPPEPDIIVNYELNIHEKELYEKILDIYKKSTLMLVVRLLQVLSSPYEVNKNINFLDLDYENEDKDEYFEINNANPIKDCFIDEILKNNFESTKLNCLIKLVLDIVKKQKNVLIWSTFIEPMYKIKKLLKKIIFFQK